MLMSLCICTSVPLLVSFAVVYVMISYELLNMMVVQSPRDRSTIEDDTTPQWTEEEVSPAPFYRVLFMLSCVDADQWIVKQA